MFRWEVHSFLRRRNDFSWLLADAGGCAGGLDAALPEDRERLLIVGTRAETNVAAVVVGVLGFLSLVAGNRGRVRDAVLLPVVDARASFLPAQHHPARAAGAHIAADGRIRRIILE